MEEILSARAGSSRDPRSSWIVSMEIASVLRFGKATLKSFRCNLADMVIGDGGAWPRPSLRFWFQSGWTSKVKLYASAMDAKSHLFRRPYYELAEVER
jgi:hypothetical protein